MEVMGAYKATIGLEIHAELKTRTKMFCDSKNDPDETRPNHNVCPVCLAHPGTLPAINEEAVKHVLRMGAAVDGTLADYSEFDRKSYFYPDIPKGYQISQYEFPLVKGGSLNGVAITRIHLEEDTARSTHQGGESLVDFNRAGIPLMELVTEPVIHDAKTAANFARELQLLLRTIGAGEANLEKGEMRIEANISVSNTDELGTKVEVKNLNSFKSVERAIAYEIDRQIQALEKGEKLNQETRGWNETKEQTFHQRFKEGSADYRYFPEPDLPKMALSERPEWSKENLRKELPELPWEKRARLIDRGVSAEAAEILVNDPQYGAIYEKEIKSIGDDRTHTFAVNLLVTDVRGKNPATDEIKNLNGTFTTIASLYVAGTLSSASAKIVVGEVLNTGVSAEQIIADKGLAQVNDSEALQTAIKAVIDANPNVVSDYKAGKEVALQFLVGQTMKQTRGAGNPGRISELLKDILK